MLFRSTYAPMVPCSRCEQTIAWPLAIEVEALFRPESEENRDRDVTLTEAELDHYYLEGDAVDLEQLVTDLVQTALPTQLVQTSDDGSSCKICLTDLRETQVYGARGGKASPFADLAKLKNLKN